MIDRVALILRAKQPFVDWINQADAGGADPALTLEEVNQECHVFLVDEEAGERLAEWLDLNCDRLMEFEMGSWYTDPKLWPKERGRKTFDRLFAIEVHSMVIDTGSGPIMAEELE